MLVAGCAHSGILNIIEHLQTEKNSMPSHVVGGFHLHNPVTNRDEDSAVVRQLAEYLKLTGAKYYTCHCTGVKPYERLKGIMGEAINYLATEPSNNINAFVREEKNTCL